MTVIRDLNRGQQRLAADVVLAVHEGRDVPPHIKAHGFTLLRQLSRQA